MSAPRGVDPIERAHLTGVSAPTPPVHRYDAPDHLCDLVRRYWVPVWSLPPGEVWVQEVLQYPVCLVVVSSDYARFYGVTTGLSSVDLAGSGWAVGAMLQPAAGALIWGGSVSEVTDRQVDLDEVPLLAGDDVVGRIRAAMAPDPHDPACHRAAIAVLEDRLSRVGPVDEEGSRVNALVARTEEDPQLVRVDDLARELGLSERALQRLTRDRLGLTPKWLIQRRRLHDATYRLKQGTVVLGDLAHELGYTDQAHFTRDFSRLTGRPPGAYLADQPGRCDSSPERVDSPGPRPSTR